MPVSHRLAAVVATVALAAFAACSHKASKEADQAAPTGSSTTTTSTTTGAAAASGTPTTAAPTKAGPMTANGTAGSAPGSDIGQQPADRSSSASPVDGRSSLDDGATGDQLAARCVTPGGAQSATVHTGPFGHVSYDTTYADSTNQFSKERAYVEGHGEGDADADGLYKASWHVPPNAPLGSATFNYIAGNRMNRLDFTVAATC